MTQNQIFKAVGNTGNSLPVSEGQEAFYRTFTSTKLPSFSKPTSCASHPDNKLSGPPRVNLFLHPVNSYEFV